MISECMNKQVLFFKNKSNKGATCLFKENMTNFENFYIDLYKSFLSVILRKLFFYSGKKVKILKIWKKE